MLKAKGHEPKPRAKASSAYAAPTNRAASAACWARRLVSIGAAQRAAVPQPALPATACAALHGHGKPDARAGRPSGTDTRMPAGTEQGNRGFVQARDGMPAAGHVEPAGVEVNDG